MFRSPLRDLAERACATGQADYVVIHLDGEGGLKAAIAVSKDKALQGALSFVRLGKVAGPNHPAQLIHRDAKPFLRDSMSEEAALSLAQDSDDYASLKVLGMQGALAVPILRNGVSVGVVAFVSRKVGRYTADDIPMVEAFAADVNQALMALSQPASQRKVSAASE